MSMIPFELEIEQQHTVTWPDGFRVSRLAEHRGSLWVEITWQGRKREIRFTKTRTVVSGSRVEHGFARENLP